MTQAAPVTTLVVGASRGLGLEFVRQLGSTPGHVVLATARDLAAATALSAMAAASPETVRLFTLDFTSKASLEALAPLLPPINRLIINAGANGLRCHLLTPEEDIAADLAELFRSNVLGPLETVRALAPLIPEGGKIQLLSSRLASMEQADMDLSPTYSVSKAALNMLGRKLAVELRPKKISVILQAPGWVKTDMGGDEAPLEPKESIAGMLKVLDDDSKSGIDATGSFFDWNGTPMGW